MLVKLTKDTIINTDLVTCIRKHRQDSVEILFSDPGTSSVIVEDMTVEVAMYTIQNAKKEG